MSGKKSSKLGRLGAILASFLVLIGIFAGVSGVMLSNDVHAVNANEESSETVTEEEAENSNESSADESNESDAEDDADTDTDTTEKSGNGCKDSLGALGWLVCPAMEKISGAVDWLYDKIEDILVINPVKAEDGSPIYEIWKYCLGLTNIVFIIFLLIVIYSQLTGLGISNYGIKKVLPKLIVTAVMVNLSFLICSLAVDVSNIIGNSLRGVFGSVEEAAVASSSMNLSDVSMNGVYRAVAGGAALTLLGGGAIAFDLGMIWMLIPTVLGAIVAVVTGLITIALRQAVVVLLIMISPLAMVANILPNTEKWFTKWKDYLIKMLVFYPIFSLLFGASSLAGFAIIMSATDGFWLMLGLAVQIFPLFFAWSLMKMSGTVLGTINSKLNGLAAKPLATNRAWAESHRKNTQLKRMASDKVYTPSAYLMNFISNRRIAREADIDENAEIIKNRGLASRASRNWKEAGAMGTPTRRGRRAYERQAQNLEYKRIIERDKNTMNRGLGYLAKEGTAEREKLDRLDARMVHAADTYKIEMARGEKIEYENAAGFHKRMEDAMNAHMDMGRVGEAWEWKRDENGNNVRVGKRSGYVFHMDPSKLEKSADLARYNAAHQIMEGNLEDVQYAVATAAQGYDTQNKIYQTKMQKYFEMTAPTQDVVNRLAEITTQDNPAVNIDGIISGLRVLNQRGDTDLLRQQVENVLNSKEGIELGTHASQALASFLMFEVKDSDPFLRRFGKYINLETAHVYNEQTTEKGIAKMRKNKRLSLNEYVTGNFEDWEEDDWEVDETGEPKRTHKVGRAKRSMVPLIEGTSLDNVERTAYKNLDDMLMSAYKDKDGNLDIERYLKKREEVETSIGPAFISASLKYLSGSEQLKNAVSFLTGYDGKGEARWSEDGDLAGSEYAEDYFRKKTLQYIKNQTPTQLLSLRSDYYASMSEHLYNEYEKTDMDGWSKEAIEERGELMKEKAEIQARYSDLPDKEAQERRAGDMKDLRERMIGAQFRQILDSSGKLNQIYRTRRSGAANNAKDWVRKWLDLDNEAKINAKLAHDREKTNKEMEEIRKKKLKPVIETDAATPNESDNKIYDEADRIKFSSYIDDLFHDMREEDSEAFFESSIDYIKRNIGKDSYVAAEYERYHKDDPYADSYTLKEFLMDLLSDLGNYY